MWIKVDDRFPEHQKVTRAAEHLGSNGIGRVLGIWVEAMCYCGRNLTDGFVPDIVARSLKADRRPMDVLHVMAMDDVRLLRRLKNGFQFHDYLDYQPSAADIKAKRKKDLDRKRGKPQGSASNGNREGFGGDSVRNREGFPSARARAIPTRPVNSKKEQGAERPSLSLVKTEPPNVRVLTALAHDVIATAAPNTEQGDLVHLLKVRAAMAKMAYDGQSTRQAIESALFQRRRKGIVA